MTEAIGADPITVVLMGEPIPWARTRISNMGALFTPTRQRNNAAALKLAAQEAMASRLPFDCPVQIDLQAEFSIPSSWSQRKQSAALRGEVRPGKRPDLTNLCKQVEDAFNTVVFRDDALIVEYGLLRKVYSQSAETRCDGAPGMSGLPSLCLWCNREFKPRRSGGSRQAFCCPSHRIAFHSAARRWAERAVSSGQLTIAELQNGPAAACTLVSGVVSRD